MKRGASTFLFILALVVTFGAVAILAPELQLVPSRDGHGGQVSALGGATATPTSTPAATLTLAPSPTATATATATAAATNTPTPTASPTPTAIPVLSRSIFVDQDAQLVHVYENGLEIRTLPCSTGLPMPGQATPPWVGVVGPFVGTFYSFDVYADDAWFLFARGFLIHSAPYLVVDGVKVYQDLEDLGRRPRSHGCIRLRPEDAEWLTRWNPEGVPIAISPMTKTEWP